MAGKQNFQQMIEAATERQIAVFESVRQEAGMTQAEFTPKVIAALQNTIRDMEKRYNGMPAGWRYKEGESIESRFQQDANDMAAYAALRYYQQLVIN